ncbi:hypothetical protein LAWI1_G008377 [Lachnellula willkommii]|uniref:ATP synthase subunit K, mitochondrial n=1 Tax=Lachnellula willkommii TaxID=215461 RepID=A0A559LZ70_9HELO|nr:hypothetical protein LAWI1_G008377 [Lachnellula willkommii]
MTVFYNIAGRQIGSHYLAIATLSTVFGGAYYALSGGSAAKKSQGPPINAQSPDEEKFIKYVYTLGPSTSIDSAESIRENAL